jgi:hypothetical protein
MITGTLVTKQLKSRFFFILLLVDNLTERPGSEQIITEPDPLRILLRIRNTDFLFIYFRQAKVYWPTATPLLTVCRSSMIFRDVWFRTLIKQARYQLSHSYLHVTVTTYNILLTSSPKMTYSSN